MIFDASAEKRLFDIWEEKYPGRVNQDGIVDPDEYTRARFRLLFLLKEVNLKDDDDSFDVRLFCHGGGRPETWDNIARWTQGILQLETDFPWADLDKDNDMRRREYLPRICAVNVKKIAGRHTANGRAIAEVVAEDRELLRQQIELYQPEILICCGTKSNLLTIYEKDFHAWTWKRTARGIEYAKDGDRIIVFYSHPEARVADCILHYSLVDAMREILGGVR